MSRLNLTRKAGQGVEFTNRQTGLEAGMTVLGVKHGAVRMYFDGGEPFILQISQSAPLPDFELQVTVAAVSRGCAKLIFEAPETVRILRTELINREAAKS